VPAVTHTFKTPAVVMYMSPTMAAPEGAAPVPKRKGGLTVFPMSSLKALLLVAPPVT
jgi:hypothetical protein